MKYLELIKENQENKKSSEKDIDNLTSKVDSYDLYDEETVFSLYVYFYNRVGWLFQKD